MSTYVPIDSPTAQLPAQTFEPTSLAIGSTSTSTSPALPPSLPAPEPESDPCTHVSTAQHVDDLFKKWTAAVAQRMHLKNRPKKDKVKPEDDQLPVLDLNDEIEVWESVFRPYVSEEEEQETGAEGKPKGKERAGEEGGEGLVKTLDHQPPVTHDQFLEFANEVRTAIDGGVQPRLNSKGSSGSYFARSRLGQTIGIFKPKDEEPYGTLNPKFTKWVHRTLSNLSPKLIPFGRSCLIPSQSYLSESAASILDRHLGTLIVPRTEVVRLSSPAFYYDWIDRERARKRKEKLREKEGSFQVFMKGFTDASDFFARHPYSSSSKKHTADHPKRRKRRNLCAPFLCLCGRAEAEEEDDDDEACEHGWGWGAEVPPFKRSEEGFEWTPEMVVSFREELEKLVIVDFLIRNTDRGLDNFMIKPCLSPPKSTPTASSSSSSTPTPTVVSSPTPPPEATCPLSCSTTAAAPVVSQPHIHLAAIDNSLAFPHEHPLGWRTYTYGWLFLPLSLIGHPWSASTRETFLPKLTDPSWWSSLKQELRNEFAKDAAFNERMWDKQWAVVKGQGWNLAESLKAEDEGPLELCRRPKKLVWDEHVLVPASVDPSTPITTAPVSVLGGSTSCSPMPSFAQAAAALDSPSSEPPSSPTSPSPQRPAVQRHRSDPPLLAKQARHRPSASLSLSHSHKKPTPRLPLVAHSRSASDYSTFSGSTSAYRPPLDRLSASLGSSSRAATAAAEEEEEDDDDDKEQTGVALMRHLDRVEANERRRAKRVQKAAVRMGLPLPQSQHEQEWEREQEREGEGSVHVQQSGSFDSPRSRWSSSFRKNRQGRVPLDRSASDGTGETSRLLGDEDHTGDEGEGEGEARVRHGAGGPERMSMSWYGGLPAETVKEEDAHEPEVEGREGANGKVKLKWVVVERIEDVKEPVRRWAWPW
ncbi:hypothetical protein JCM1840_003157 [Sporobolomyces johnsonii]